MQSKFNPPVVVEMKKKIATRNELKPALIARVDFMASKFNLSGNWLHLIWMDVPQVHFYIYTFVANDRNDVPIIYLEMLHFYNDNDGEWLELLVSKIEINLGLHCWFFIARVMGNIVSSNLTRKSSHPHDLRQYWQKV